MTPLAAAITAGGASRRYGSDKALALWAGRSLLERVAESLSACEPKILVAPVGKYHLPGWQTVPDGRPGEGPLAGLEVALEHAPGWLAFAAVDLPNLSSSYWATLARHREGASIVCPLDAKGRPQLLAALYHASLQEGVTALLDEGERRVRALLGRAAVREVPWEVLAPLGAELFRNVNTPAELYDD